MPGPPPDAKLPGLLRAAAAEAGLELGAEEIHRLERYLETLLLWRERLALVSQTTAAAIVGKHVRDSMAVVPLVRGARRIADLGSGGGFPGMVLAILCPETEVVLVESQRRKASFLRDALRQTATANGRVAEARAEDLPETLRDLDLVVSRAVWPAMQFLDLARPLLRPGGVAIAMKTPREASLVGPPAGYATLESVPYTLGAGEQRVLLSARRTDCST